MRVLAHERTWAAVAARDRVVVGGGMLTLLTLAWAYLFLTAPYMTVAIAGPDVSRWGGSQFAMAVTMWTVMMLAMMLPTVAPWVTALATLSAGPAPGASALPAGQFLAGYLLVWTGYSLVAASLQWVLHEGGLLSASASLAGGILPAFLVVAAGLFQWTPAKRACLKHCRSPLGFFLTSWRAGRWGALRMGLQHGWFCVACCWALMALSFVAGVMNLAWMALVTVFVLVDHAVVLGDALGRVAGAGLLAWGIWMVW